MQWLQLILALSILVVIHELGHFCFARLFKVRVEKFYMFFNPKFSIVRAKKINGKWQVKFFAPNVASTMVPVLDGGGKLDQSTQYYLSNNALYCAAAYEQPLLGLRAFFTSASPTPIRARVVFGENEATSIPMVTTPETKAQKIIQDGRLIIIRGEHQYNAQGQMIE